MTVLGPPPALGSPPRDPELSPQRSKRLNVRANEVAHTAGNRKDKGRRRHIPVCLLGAGVQRPVHQDTQGARQQVSLAATPAAAAFVGTLEHCGAGGTGPSE